MRHIKSFVTAHKKLTILFAILLLLLLVFRLAVQPALAASAAPAAPVQTFALEKGSIATSLTVSGTVEPAQSSTVSSTLTYPVEKVCVQVGDYVSQGDVLALLDTADLDARIATARSNLSAAGQELQATVDQAARRVEDARNQQAFDNEHIAQSYVEIKKDNDEIPLAQQQSWENTQRADSIAIEDAQAALTNALLALQAQDDSSLSQLSTERKNCTITAPMSGIVTSVSAQVGAPATTVAVVENQDSFIVKANIKEYDVNQVKPGQSVTIVTGAEDQFSGTVTRVAPRAQIVNNSTTYPVEIALSESSSALRLGMSAKAKIALEQRENVFVVPLDALGTAADGSAEVWVQQDDGSFEAVPVETGLENDFAVEISSGALSEGMQLQSLAPDSVPAEG